MRAEFEAETARLNATGSGDSIPISLLVADDQCSAAEAERVAHGFVAQGVTLVVGHPCGNAAKVAAPIYAAAGIWFVSAAANGRPPSPSGAPVIALDRGPAREAEETVIALGDVSKQRIAIVQDRTAYARGLSERFSRVLKDRGGAVTLNEGIVAGENTYAAVVAKLTTVDVETVYFVGYPPELAILTANRDAARARFRIVACEAAIVRPTAGTMDGHSAPRIASMVPLPASANERRDFGMLSVTAPGVAGQVLRALAGAGGRFEMFRDLLKQEQVHAHSHEPVTGHCGQLICP